MDMEIKNVKDCYGACNDTSFHVFLGFKFMSSRISFRLIPVDCNHREVARLVDLGIQASGLRHHESEHLDL